MSDSLKSELGPTSKAHFQRFAFTGKIWIKTVLA